MLCCVVSVSAVQAPAGLLQGDVRVEVAGVSFLVPKGWTSERVGGGFLLLAPRPEKGWHANIFVEFGRDRQNRSLEQVIADLVTTFAAHKPGFKELARSVEEHPLGLKLASIEYLNESESTPLREREVVIALDGSERLFIVLSSEAGLFGKYQPVFSDFIASMSKP